MENLSKAFKRELWFWFINQGILQKMVTFAFACMPLLFMHPILQFTDYMEWHRDGVAWSFMLWIGFILYIDAHMDLAR